MSGSPLVVVALLLPLALLGCDGKPDEDTETGRIDTGDTDTGDTDTGDTDTGDADTGDTDTGDTETGDTETGDTETGDTDSGDTDTDSGDTDADTATGDTDSGETGWSGRDTAETGDTDTDTDTAGPDTACDRDDCSDTSRPPPDTGDTGDVCDRDDCSDTGTSVDTSDTSDTGDVCDRDDGCGDTAGDTGTDTGDTGGTSPTDTETGASGGDSGDTGASGVDTSASDTADTADSADTGDTADTGATSAEQILIATYADWSAGTGTYTVWDWPDGTEIVADVALTTRDNMVDCDTDRVFLNARQTGTYDTINVMDPATGVLGDQWVLDIDANPWDIDYIDGSYWVSLYNEARIDLYDASGVVTESIDLTPYADSDGTSEPASTWEDGAYTYVVLSGHDESRGTYGTPQLLQMDTATRVVNWALSLSGSLVAGVGHRLGDSLYVQNQGTLTYDAYTGSVTPNLDGGFEIVDLAAGTTSGLVLAEADVNATFDSFVAIDGTATGWLVITDQSAGAQTVEFADLDAGTLTTVFTVSGYTLRRLSLDDDGTFWTLEEDSSSGATTSAWVHRDTSFAELGRFELGEGLYQMTICTL